MQPKHDLLVEKDIEIPVRDGVRLKADLSCPKGAGRFLAILNIGGYRKDKVWVPPSDLEEKANPYMNWETVNPLWWIPRGYTAVRVDTRGSGKSPGTFDPWSRQEALDSYDCIEWAGRQKWCNGRAGLSGISYFGRFYLKPAKVSARVREPVERLLVPTAPNQRGALAYSATGMSKAGIASASWTSTVLPGSLPHRPYHAHDERLWLKKGQPVRLDVELWPTCMVFRKGHRLRLDIQPRDGVGSAPYTHYSADYNVGDNTVYTSGSMASHLLLPVIPRN